MLDILMSRYAEESGNINFTNPEDISNFSAKPSSEEQDDCYITHYSAPLANCLINSETETVKTEL